MTVMAEPSRPLADTYLYAVVGAEAVTELGDCGLDGARVDTVVEGRLAAVISAAPGTALRPERRFLAAHQEVVTRLMADTTPLPVTFGVVAGSVEEIRNLLVEHQPELIAQLERVDDKVEFSVRGRWVAANIFEYFVAIDAGLCDARDRLFDGGREPSHEERIGLGQLFEAILDRERQRLTAEAEQILDPSCAEICRNRCRDEHQVMDLACLVPRDGEAEFEASLVELGKFFDDSLSFKYSGPWPPAHFVDLELGS